MLPEVPTETKHDSKHGSDRNNHLCPVFDHDAWSELARLERNYHGSNPSFQAHIPPLTITDSASSQPSTSGFGQAGWLHSNAIGDVFTMTYDGKGDVDRIAKTSENNNYTFMLVDHDGKWNYTIRDGDRLVANGAATDVSVGKNGDYTYTTSDGKFTQKADGTLVLETDDGLIHTFKYDQQGKVDKIEVSAAGGGNDGRLTFVRQPDGSWTENDPVTGDTQNVDINKAYGNIVGWVRRG